MPNRTSDLITSAETIERLDRDYINMLDSLYNNNMVYSTTTTNTGCNPQPVEAAPCNLSDCIEQLMATPVPDARQRVHDSDFSDISEPCLSQDGRSTRVSIEFIQEIYYNICRCIFAFRPSEAEINTFLYELSMREAYNMMDFNVSKNKIKNILLTGDF